MVIGKWIEQIGASDSCKYFTDSTDNIVKHFYWDGQYWQPAMYVRDYVTNITTCTIRVWCPPNCFVQVYVTHDGVNYTATGAVTASATAQNIGVTVPWSDKLIHSYKVLIYNNNCSYGYTNRIDVIH
jgi:hypothetical protein